MTDLNFSAASGSPQSAHTEYFSHIACCSIDRTTFGYAILNKNILDKNPLLLLLLQ
jgi:hypothetical protein